MAKPKPKTKPQPRQYTVKILANGQETDHDCTAIEVGEDGSLRLYQDNPPDMPILVYADGHWSTYAIIEHDPT
jgi:hypothetical protein